MIHYLKIRNFGPVRGEAELNFEIAEHLEEDAYEVRMPDNRRLLKLAYIYGANASGKTTFLNGFDFLRRILLYPLAEKSGELSFDPFLFCEDPYAKPSYLELSFYIHGIRHLYSLDFTKESVLSEKLVFYQSKRPAELFSRTTDPGKRLAKVQFGSRIKVPSREKDLLEGNMLHNNTVLGAYAKTNVDIPALEELNKWFESFLLGTITSEHNLTDVTAALIDKNPRISEWINKILYKADDQIAKVIVPESDDLIAMPADHTFHHDFRNAILQQRTASSLDTGGNIAASGKFFGGPVERRIEFLHKADDGNIYPLSIQKESSGTKRYFGLAGPLYELIHGVHLLCIDELETSLHSDLMKYFLQVFLMNSERSQLLITTHNLSLMADPDFIRRDALWFTEKESDGSVSLFSAADFDTDTLRKDASLINAYKSGRLGAKPNLGSPYISE
ncbi:MAG TPA: ATP-binding protein [Sphingobacteriaceae bacterium]